MNGIAIIRVVSESATGHGDRCDSNEIVRNALRIAECDRTHKGAGATGKTVPAAGSVQGGHRPSLCETATAAQSPGRAWLGSSHCHGVRGVFTARRPRSSALYPRVASSQRHHELPRPWHIVTTLAPTEERQLLAGRSEC